MRAFDWKRDVRQRVEHHRFGIQAGLYSLACIGAAGQNIRHTDALRTLSLRFSPSRCQGDPAKSTAINLSGALVGHEMTFELALAAVCRINVIICEGAMLFALVAQLATAGSNWFQSQANWAVIAAWFATAFSRSSTDRARWPIA